LSGVYLVTESAVYPPAVLVVQILKADAGVEAADVDLNVEVVAGPARVLVRRLENHSVVKRPREWVAHRKVRALVSSD